MNQHLSARKICSQIYRSGNASALLESLFLFNRCCRLLWRPWIGLFPASVKKERKKQGKQNHPVQRAIYFHLSLHSFCPQNEV